MTISSVEESKTICLNDWKEARELDPVAGEEFSKTLAYHGPYLKLLNPSYCDSNVSSAGIPRSN
ncbi:unnamed protein product [Nesidiocoris tenuis]|uniref:Uncharacterized protein n=1 Tax=Nesidiocoris tenuis TaxID=355587 RepID=A0A6H5HRJ9_9HEMI|nr:unnamed protein product [Nesidiocoris tenuis]